MKINFFLIVRSVRKFFRLIWKLRKSMNIAAESDQKLYVSISEKPRIYKVFKCGLGFDI